MKRKTLRTTRYIMIGLTAAAVGLVVANAVKIDAEADDHIRQIDSFIASHELRTDFASEPETVGLSYSDWKEQQNDDLSNFAVDPDSGSADMDIYPSESGQIDIYSMDVWTLGAYLYGIPEIDTTRSLILISYEAYGPDSPLSYYVACACWTRATNNYMGADNIYTAFGGMDPQYDLYMDSFGWDAYAEDALRECYLNPMYITGCNGMDSPESWIYEEDGIYVW